MYNFAGRVRSLVDDLDHLEEKPTLTPTQGAGTFINLNIKFSMKLSYFCAVYFLGKDQQNGGENSFMDVRVMRSPANMAPTVDPMRVMRGDPTMNLRVMKKNTGGTNSSGRVLRGNPMDIRVMRRSEGRPDLRVMKRDSRVIRSNPNLGIRVMRRSNKTAMEKGSVPEYMNLRVMRGDPDMGVRIF